MPARILIVDEHLIARTAIRRLLDGRPFRICGEARDGKEAIEKVIELEPDIILLDINMPVMNGIQTAYEMRRIAPFTKIVFFTVHDSPQLVSAMRVFSNDFVSKSAAGTELIPTLNRLAGITGGKPPNRSTKSPRAAA